MQLHMHINCQPFISVDFDFHGKNGTEARAEYLSQIAAVLVEEFAKEIGDTDPEIFYVAPSRWSSEEFTSFEEKQILVRNRLKKL